MLAQITQVPDSPGALWILGAAVAIGGPAMIGLMGLSMRSVSKVNKEASNDSSRLIDKLFAAVDAITTRSQEGIDRLSEKFEASITRICDVHEKALGGVEREIRNLRKDSSAKLDAIPMKLDLIHQDIRQQRDNHT